MIEHTKRFEGTAEQTRNYNKKTAVKAFFAGALGALTLMLSSCGDTGSDKVEKCPSEYYHDHQAVKPRALSNLLRTGTNSLIFRIRDEFNGGYGYGERDIALSDINSKYQTAAEDIFRVDEDASVAAGEKVLILGYGRSDTNVDEPGEIVCSAAGGEFFPTEAAESAETDLEVAGLISLEFGPNS